jgi:hypothetical protein
MSTPNDMLSSTTLGEYRYDELPLGDVIRYMVLKAGSNDDPLECTLHTAPMSEVDFEAVSYVWGSDIRDKQIACDGHTFALTTNLFRVLHRVRQPHASRTIWADLICINQENLEEKSYQVAIMGKIYSCARQVLIHMGGNDNGHSPHVCSLIATICNTIDRTLSLTPNDWNAFPYPKEDDAILIDSRWDSVSLLLDETWFTRGWVVREAGSAKDCQVYWGKSEFSWNSLMRTLNWLYKRAIKTLYDKGFDSKIPLAHVELFEDRYPEYAKLFSDEITWVNSSLLGYLSLTRQLNLKDPRDRIYAFLELVHDEQRQVKFRHFRPNYKDHFLQVYQQFAVEYIQTTSYIGLLSNVEHNKESLGSSISSWVPRWDISLTRTGYAFAPPDSAYPALTARDGSVTDPIVTDETALKVKGVILDEVLYASEALDFATTTTDTIRAIWRSVESLVQECPYPKVGRLTLFMGILTAGTREGDIMDWLQSDAGYYQLLHNSSENPNELDSPNTSQVEPGSIDMFHNTVKGYTHNRKIILTKRGYMGLAPYMTQKGDECGIIFGCNTPCILRTSGQESRYKYLGATYMIGQDHWTTAQGRVVFSDILGSERSKDWTEWDVEERDIYLC